MKVALVHDYLNQLGGAERVLEALLKIFPDAHIYTLLYSKDRTQGRFEQNIHKTSFLDFEIVKKHHRPFIPLMPRAIEKMQINENYDLIFSDTAGYAKGITIKKTEGRKKPVHISYCHTPLRYAWEYESYFKSDIFKAFFKPAFVYLKNWDYKAGQVADAIIANSEFIRDKIKNYYKREAEVVYPPVFKEKFSYQKKLDLLFTEKKYYLAVGRLLGYKRFDLVIEAFKELGLPLKVVGQGSEYENLKFSAKNSLNIQFISDASDDDLLTLYHGAKALVFPQVEDFGLVAAEAQTCGVPVIAYSCGGALEIVNDGLSGVFFSNQKASEIVLAVKRFEKMKFNRKKISVLGERFSFNNFKKGIEAVVDENFESA